MLAPQTWALCLIGGSDHSGVWLGLAFGVEGLGFRAWGLGFGELGLRDWGLELGAWGQGSEFGGWGLRTRPRFRVLGQGFAARSLRGLGWGFLDKGLGDLDKV